MPAVRRIGVPVLDSIHEVTFVYLATFDEPRTLLKYLQAVRSGRLDLVGGEEGELARAYHGQRDRLTAALIAELGPRRFDAILGPPSRRNHHLPFLQRAKATFLDAIDLTSCFSNPGGLTAAEGTTVAALTESLHFVPPSPVPRLTEVLVVDDTLATGTTVAALINHLKPHCDLAVQFTLACPLWVKASAGESAQD